MNYLNTKPTTGIKAKKKFYKFCVKSGIDLANFDPERINFEGTFLIHCFKINPAETKTKYNHIFKHVKNKKVELNPNINNLIFEPKN